MHQVSTANPKSSDAQALLEALSCTLQQITGSSGKASFDPEDVLVEGACFAIARTPSGVAIGCGALRPLEPGVAELKRMFSASGQKGVGSSILEFLELKAVQLGYREVWLETRRVNQRAVAFYSRHAYNEIQSFGRYVGRPEAICLGKRLHSASAQLANPSVELTNCSKLQSAAHLER